MFNYNVEKNVLNHDHEKQPNNLLCKFFSYIHNLFWVIFSGINIFYQFYQMQNFSIKLFSSKNF